MSIASDIRSYADTAVSQGKQVLDQAQAQLNDVTGQANEFAGKANEFVSDIAEKATGAVTDLRSSAEKAINFGAIKTAVEPYLAQVKTYTASVTDRAEVLFQGVKNDERVAKLVDTAGSVTGVVVETVQDRVVKPVQSLTGRGRKPAAPKAATTKPAAKPAATRPAPSKPASKPAARKAPARRTKA
jgi:ABC-type transporter Mla subunit MlaD